MAPQAKSSFDEERIQVIDELIELLELQIRLKEGGILFRMARMLGLPGTRLEHVQEKLRKRFAARRELRNQDLETLREAVEFSKIQLAGSGAGLDESRAEFNKTLLELEQLMKEVARRRGGS